MSTSDDFVLISYPKKIANFLGLELPVFDWDN